MNDSLYVKCINQDFKKLFDKKGYAFFTKGYYNLNIIGVRKHVEDNQIKNIFDDYLVVDYNTPKGHIRDIYPITTEPGLYYMMNPLSKGGAAILVAGQYKGCYQIAKHRGLYNALCQRKTVTVYRDNNKNSTYDCDPKKTQSGLFGINIHRSSSSGAAYTIDKYSAGCQVFKDIRHFRKFMLTCNEAKKIFGNSFTYTLIDEKDLE